MIRFSGRRFDRFVIVDGSLSGWVRSCQAQRFVLGEQCPGDAREFRNGRQFAAWIGLVPGQYSTGGKTRLGHISKRGDAYLRNLLVQGARSVLQSASSHQDRLSRWALELQPRRGYYRTLVAIANKNARIAWALLAKNETLHRA